MTTVTKNRFAGAAFDDSDDDVQVNKTKTQKKKEAAKITEKPQAEIKFNTKKMAEGGFEVTNNSKKSNQVPKPERNQRPQTARGMGRGRGGRPRGGDGEKPFRPNTGRQVTTNEDGEQVSTKRGGDRK